MRDGETSHRHEDDGGYDAGNALARRHPRQAGAIGGLTDIALAVVVGSLALVGVVGFYQTSSTTARLNSEIAALTSLVANIRTTYQQAGTDYTDLGTATAAATLISLGVVPQQLVSGTTLRSNFGGTIAIGTASANANFTLSYPNIPANACAKLISTANTALTGIMGVSVAGSAVVSPFTLGNAQAACSTTGGVITFTFN